MRPHALLLVAVVLAGCGDGGEPKTPPPPVTSEPVAATTSAMGEPSLAEAGRVYLRLVAASNKAGGALDDYLSSTGDSLSQDEAARARVLSGRWADSLRSLSLALQAASWPRSVQPQVDALVSHVIAQQLKAREAARSKTTEDLVNALKSLPQSGEAEALRQKLGLPETPG